MYDVAIIGAGVVGSMIARELTKYRLEVCLAESRNDVAMGQSKANSAIVHAGYDAMTGTLKAKLNVRGSEMMAKVTSELGVKYRNNGALIKANGLVQIYATLNANTTVDIYAFYLVGN